MTSCYEDIGQNEEGFIYNSWTGESSEVLPPGSHNVGTRGSMVVQSLETHKSEFKNTVLTKNGLNVEVVVVVNWMSKKGTVKTHKNKFNLDGEVRYIQPVVYATIKDIVGKYLPEEIYSSKRELVESGIKDRINTKFQESGIFDMDMCEIKDVNLPKSVADEIEQKIKEEEKAKRELAKAETARAQAESRIAKAEGDAKAAKFEAEMNRVNSAAITPNVIRMRELDLQEKWISVWAQKWGGGVPSQITGEEWLNFMHHGKK